MNKRFLLVVLVGVMLAGAVFAATPVTLTVGWDSAEPYQIGGTPPSGIDLDLATAVLTQAGYKPDFRKLPWARQLENIQSGTLDIVMDASRTPERAKYADFTSTYRHETAVLMTATADTSKIKALKDLIGQTTKIGVIQDSVYGGEFASLMGNQGFTSLLEPAPDSTTNLKKLLAGRFPFIIDDPVIVQNLVTTGKLGAVKTVFTIVNDDVYFMISKKTLAADPTLLDKLNKAIDVLIKNGTFKAIYARYGVTL